MHETKDENGEHEGLGNQNVRGLVLRGQGVVSVEQWQDDVSGSQIVIVLGGASSGPGPAFREESLGKLQPLLHVRELLRMLGAKILHLHA